MGSELVLRQKNSVMNGKLPPETEYVSCINDKTMPAVTITSELAGYLNVNMDNKAQPFRGSILLVLLNNTVTISFERVVFTLQY
jgi:hypothetical protein